MLLIPLVLLISRGDNCTPLNVLNMHVLMLYKLPKYSFKIYSKKNCTERNCPAITRDTFTTNASCNLPEEKRLFSFNLKKNTLIELFGHQTYFSIISHIY